MADGSQHSWKIMETKTRFNLNAAVQNWQQELAAQPELTPEVRCELETHLRDTLFEFQRRGLNDEESFWLARRRAGRAEQLGEEFAKADPARVWRERLFWIALALLAMQLWQNVTAYCLFEYYPIDGKHFQDALNGILPAWVSFYLPQWFTEIKILTIKQLLHVLIQYGAVACFALWLLKRRFDRVPWGIKFLFESRIRFLIYTLTLLIGTDVLRMLQIGRMAGSADWSSISAVHLSYLTWQISLACFIAWHMPERKAPAPKRV